MCNQLQAVDMNVKAVNDHVSKLTGVFQFHCKDTSEEFVTIFLKSQNIC